MYGLYSRVDGESYNKRPKYRRDSYSGHFDLFYSDSDSSYLDWVVGGTWAITKRYDEDEYSAPLLDYLVHRERSRVGVISFVQFATCPHHATRFCESQVPGVAGNGYVLRNISMQEISLPTPAPKPFAEVAEWLRDNDTLVFFFSLGLFVFPILLFACCTLMVSLCFEFEESSRAQANVEQTLDGIKQLLQSHEHLQDFCVNPSLESLESSVAETIAEEQELLHYYLQKSDEDGWSVIYHAWSFCANVYMWFCLAYIVFENVSGLCDVSSARVIRGFVIGAILLSHFIVLVESCTSPEEKFLRNVREVQQASRVIDQMVCLEPRLCMQACAFHLETRLRALHQIDASGNSRLTATFNEEVATAENSEFIPLRYWHDLSVGDVLRASNRGVTRLFVESIICAGDRRTLEIIDSRYAQFQYGHQHSDAAFVQFQLDYEIPGMQKRLIICDNNPPWWMNRKVFYLASFLGLTWIYRFCLKMMTSSSTLVLVKQVFVDDTSEAWGHLCWPGWAKLLQEEFCILNPSTDSGC